MQRRSMTTGPFTDGRLRARPGRSPEQMALPGMHRLSLRADRDALMYVSESYRPEQPAPLVLMLHGAGGEPRGGLSPFLPLADESGLILLAPASQLQTWDVIHGGYGPDVACIDRALSQVFARYAIDPGRIAVEGFSDGASYALSIGITNGDLFTHVIAFSPGFMAPAGQQGDPRIFMSHGLHDTVLPVDRCSRRLLPVLRSAGYDVVYHEFDGPHAVPPQIARAAAGWFIGRQDAAGDRLTH